MAEKITDKQRLDWLLTSGNGVYDSEDGWVWAMCGETGYQSPTVDNPRAAIDAAIRASRPSRGK